MSIALNFGPEMAIFLVFFLVFSAVSHEPSLISAHKPTTSSPRHPDHSVVDASNSGTIELAPVVAGGSSQNLNSNPESPPDVQNNDPLPTCSSASTSTGPTISDHTVPSGEISIGIDTNPNTGINTVRSTDSGTSDRERRTTTGFFSNLLARAKQATAGDHVNDDQGLFELVKTFMSLAFQAAIAVMVSQLQPPGGNPSPSSSSSSSSSFLPTMGGEAILFCFTFCIMAIRLRQHHPNVANFFGSIGILSGAVAFFLMMAMYIPGRYVSSLWTAASLLFVVFFYTLPR